MSSPSNENTPARRQPDRGSESYLAAGLAADTTTSGALQELNPGQLRDQGVYLAGHGTDPWWADGCDRVIAHLAQLDVVFSADHVLAQCGLPERPNQVGPRFHAAIRNGVIRPVGFTLSTRPSRHRGVVRLYRGGGTR